MISKTMLSSDAIILFFSANKKRLPYFAPLVFSIKICVLTQRKTDGKSHLFFRSLWMWVRNHAPSRSEGSRLACETLWVPSPARLESHSLHKDESPALWISLFFHRIYEDIRQNCSVIVKLSHKVSSIY